MSLKSYSAADMLALVKAKPDALPDPPKRPTQGDFRNLIRQTRRSLSDLAQELADGLDPREWADRFKIVLNGGHAQAWMLGRNRAGDLLPFDFMDALQGIAAADSEADYLLSFLEDILEKDDRYFDEDGNILADKVARRSRMYTGLMRGTANESWSNAQPDEAEIYWRLGAVEEHCSDCPELASLNPWSKDTLFAKPGSNETPCLFNCKCWLEVLDDDGDWQTGFKPVL